MNLQSWLRLLPLLLLVGPARAHGPVHEQIIQVTAELARHPHDPALRLRRGELHRLDEQWAAARTDFQRARTLAPKSPDPLLGLGRLALDEGQFAAAITALEGCLTLRSNQVEAHVLLARALVRSRREPEATSHFSRALALAAEPRPEWFIERSQAQLAPGYDSLAEVLAGLDQGLAQLGPIPTLQLAAIELELRRHDFDAALRRLDTILAGSERQEQWLQRQGEILELAGRGPAARTAYTAARAAFEALPPRLQRSFTLLNFQRELDSRLAALSAAPETAPSK